MVDSADCMPYAFAVYLLAGMDLYLHIVHLHNLSRSKLFSTAAAPAAANVFHAGLLGHPCYTPVATQCYHHDQHCC